MKTGPLFVLADTNVKLAKALRNIPGVDVANVNALDIRQLAPGSHLGRFIVWTKSAFTSLNGLYGTPRLPS
jgi:large subunit ribosomal protein L4e